MVQQDGLTRDVRDRVVQLVDQWHVDVDKTLVTSSSVLAFGRRRNEGVVVKVARAQGDEWHAGSVLVAFGARGSVRVYDAVEGAALLERLDPGEPLVDSALDDEEAMTVIAETIALMHAEALPASLPMPTAADWGRGFARYRASGDAQVAAELVNEAEAVYLHLCETQSSPRLLHGDLHHGNILRDARHGWLAIDPKGVIGEPEYEAGAALRNPWGRPEMFADPAVIERRVAILGTTLRFDEGRALSWAFGQAVLSAAWDVEDGVPVDAGHGCLALARTLRKMLAR